MTRLSVIILALAAVLTPGLAGAKPSTNPSTTQAQTSHAARRAVPPSHIACTKLGCFPVAPNCYPHTQLDWWGNPTGYDQITCR